MKKPDRTQQHFEKECNINSIMKRYAQTGILVTPGDTSRRMPMYGDFRSVKSFLDAQNLVVHAKSVFDGLPAEFRYRFQNDVGLLLSWIEKPENKREAQKFGFIAPDPVIPPESDTIKLIKKIDELVSRNEDSETLKPRVKKLANDKNAQDLT